MGLACLLFPSPNFLAHCVFNYFPVNVHFTDAPHFPLKSILFLLLLFFFFLFYFNTSNTPKIPQKFMNMF